MINLDELIENNKYNEFAIDEYDDSIEIGDGE